jgi:hypothetical protein
MRAHGQAPGERITLTALDQAFLLFVAIAGAASAVLVMALLRSLGR